LCQIRKEKSTIRACEMKCLLFFQYRVIIKLKTLTQWKCYMCFSRLVNVKVKLFLCLTKYHIMKTYGVMEVQLHAFLTSALDGGEWSVSRHTRFIPRKGARCVYWLGDWVPEPVWTRWRKKNVCLCRESNPSRPGHVLLQN
jgi:hypothetical protein